MEENEITATTADHPRAWSTATWQLTLQQHRNPISWEQNLSLHTMMGVVFSFLTALCCSLSTCNGCGWIKKVILYVLPLKLDLVLFSLAEYKSENCNLLQYQQFKMFCLDPVLAIGYQHSSLSCFCWLQVYNPQFRSLNLSLRRYFTTQGCGGFFTLEKNVECPFWSVPFFVVLLVSLFGVLLF